MSQTGNQGMGGHNIKQTIEYRTIPEVRVRVESLEKLYKSKYWKNLENAILCYYPNGPRNRPPRWNKHRLAKEKLAEAILLAQKPVNKKK